MGPISNASRGRLTAHTAAPNPTSSAKSVLRIGTALERRADPGDEPQLGRPTGRDHEVGNARRLPAAVIPAQAGIHGSMATKSAVASRPSPGQVRQGRAYGTLRAPDSGVRRNDAGGLGTIRCVKTPVQPVPSANPALTYSRPSHPVYTPRIAAPKRGCKRAADVARPGGWGVGSSQAGTPGSAEEQPCFRPRIRRVASSGCAGPGSWEELPASDRQRIRMRG